MKRKSFECLLVIPVVMVSLLVFTTRGREKTAPDGLMDLVLSYDLSPGIALNPAFSPSIHRYTVAVDSTNVRQIKIAPRAISDQDRITINGTAVDPAKSSAADLKAGDNTFAINVISANGNTSIYSLTITQKDLSGLYKYDLVQKGLWRITDYSGFPPNEDMYLIEGAGKALLIDAGMGKGDLARLVKSLTPLPVEIAITHGHGDHMGQVGQFAGAVVYMSEKDKGMVPSTIDSTNFKWVKDGDTIDLGAGRTIEVIEVPGHTPGCIMFLDRAGKTLAIGDAIGSGMYVWMFMPGAPSLGVYRDTLKRLEARLAPYESLTFLTGHHWQERTPLTGTKGKQMVTDMRVLCEKIIGGEIIGKPDSMNFGARKIDVRTAEYGLAGIWYNRSNIQ